MTKSKNYAAECAMKCAEPLFMEFLAEVSDIPIGATNFATDAIYKLCAISSRNQLNTEPTAQENWKRTKIWFRLWRTGYGKNKPAFKMGNDAFRRRADLDENPFDEHAKVDIYPGKFEMWRQGWLTEKGMKGD